MINCRVLFLNGPINSGKSTIGKILSQQLKDAVFLEGDEVVSKEDLSFQQWTVATVMTATLKACELAHELKLPIIAFPLRDSDWKIISKLCDHAGVAPICITLDPGQDIALSARSGRELTVKEKERIQEMYQEGYHERIFSSLVLHNGDESAEATSRKIEAYLKSRPQD
jgi:hypothetical protein